jgi:hypothetical protein
LYDTDINDLVSALPKRVKNLLLNSLRIAFKSIEKSASFCDTLGKKLANRLPNLEVLMVAGIESSEESRFAMVHKFAKLEMCMLRENSYSLYSVIIPFDCSTPKFMYLGSNVWEWSAIGNHGQNFCDSAEFDSKWSKAIRTHFGTYVLFVRELLSHL